MTSGWFYLKPDRPSEGRVGPLVWEELWRAAREGALSPQDVVWHPQLPDWTPATQVPGLFPEPAGKAKEATKSTGKTRPAWFVPVVTIAAVAAIGLVVGLAVGLTRSDQGPARNTVAGSEKTWTVMIYADADDEILEEDMLFDLNEAEWVGSTDQVNLVAQIDRFEGGYAGDGDATTARRYLLTQDADLYALGSPVLEELGEIDMGDPQTLYDFATWAIEKFPADSYVLIMSDHGSGWAGGWTDDAPTWGSGLGVQQIDNVLAYVVADTGIGAFELVGMDACLMAQAEVMGALAPHARYAVASEETEPALGWSYAGFLSALTEDTSMSGRELGQAIVDSYIAQDVRVVNDDARRLLTGGEYSAQDVAEELGRDTTLSTIDLGEVRDLAEALNELAVALTGIDQGLVAEARAYAQSYTSLFTSDDPNEQLPPSLIDLGSFVDLLLELTDDAGVVEAGERLQQVLAQAVVSESHGVERPGSTGLTIYFPASAEYAATFSGDFLHYPSSIGRFAAASLWDDFLTYHYTGEMFDPGEVDLGAVTPALASLSDFTRAVEQSSPSEDASVVGPGSGGVSIAPITVSADTIAADEAVTLYTEIAGSNIAYVYYYIAYYWEEDGSFLSADAGFVEPGTVKEVNGVYYPDWGDGEPVEVEQEWEPTIFYMSDGNADNDQFAFFQPTVYGSEVAGDIYTVMGTYTFIDTGTSIDAEIDFTGEGEMLSVWGYTSNEQTGVGAWHELTPGPGDTFNITNEYLEFDQDPDGMFVDYEGGTMTFGENPFTIAPYWAPAGDYVIGFGVEDLDGEVIWEYAYVTVTE